MKKNIIPKHRFQAVFGPTRPWLRLPPKRELSKEKKITYSLSLKKFLFLFQDSSQVLQGIALVIFLNSYFRQMLQVLRHHKKIIQETWNAMLFNVAKHAPGIRTKESNWKTLNHSALGKEYSFSFFILFIQLNISITLLEII